MNTTEKENHGEIALLQDLCKKFEKENDMRSILRVKALIAYYKGMSPEVIAQCYEISQKTVLVIENLNNKYPSTQVATC